MKKFLWIITALVVMIAGLAGVSAPVNAVSPATTASAVVASEQPAPVVTVTLKGISKISFKKVARCASSAMKHEEQAPPADPSASCINKLRGKKFVVKVWQKCYPPLLGGSAYAKVSVSQRVVARAVSKSMAPRVRVAVRTVIKDKVLGKAKVNLTCAYPPVSPPPTPTPTPTPTPPPPPVVPGPQLLEVDTINDVLINNSRYITVVGTVASGHTATLFATADNGGSITAGKTQQVSGMFTVKVTYRAPSEPPLANNGLAAGKDRVSFTLTQDDGQVAKKSTNQFDIKVPLPDPM